MRNLLRSACRGGSEEREVRERGRVDDVVAPAVTEEVAEHAQAEDDRRQQAPPPAPRVERHPRPNGDDADARNVWLGVTLPLAQGEER